MHCTNEGNQNFHVHINSRTTIRQANTCLQPLAIVLLLVPKTVFMGTLPLSNTGMESTVEILFYRRTYIRFAV